MKRTLGTVSACLTLAACGGPDHSPQVSALKTVRSAIVSMTDCGTFNLSQGERLLESAARCLVDAVQAGHPARLKVTSPTTEGDPIPVTYTAGADGRVEVITDSTQDGFGTQVITSQTCTEPTVAPELRFAQCSDPTPTTK